MDALWAGWQPSLPGTSLPPPEIALRLLAAALCSGLLGLDRELRRKRLGLRTHMLIALGAASFALLTVEMVHVLEARDLQFDPTRMVEGIIGGIGFIGAGAIIRDRGEVRGATTGAGIWLVGAIGLGAGLGLYIHAAMITLFALIVLSAMSAVSRHIRPEDDEAADDGAAPSGRRPPPGDRRG